MGGFRRSLKKIVLSDPSITLLETRDAKAMKITSFQINKGCSQEAVNHLIALLEDSLQITLNNEWKADGFTELKLVNNSIYSRTSGHGSLGEWSALSVQDAKKKIKMLSQFNEGGSTLRTGCIEQKII